MGTKIARSGVRVLVVVALLGGMLAVPTPAQAEKVQQCTYRRGIGGPLTIGVNGQPVATTPYGWVEACATVYTGDPAARIPAPEIRTGQGGDAILLHWPEDYSVWAAQVTVSYDLNGAAGSQSVIVPLPSQSGQTTCVAFYGSASYNPGGCLFYIEG